MLYAQRRTASRRLHLAAAGAVGVARDGGRRAGARLGLLAEGVVQRVGHGYQGVEDLGGAGRRAARFHPQEAVDGVGGRRGQVHVQVIHGNITFVINHNGLVRLHC